MTTGRRYFGVLAGAVISLGLAASSKAALVLVLTEPGYASETITDGGASDIDHTANGSIEFVGTYHDFTTTIDVATSNSPGVGGGGEISLDAVQIKTNAGTPTGRYSLTLAVEDNGFTLPATGTVSLTSTLGGSITTAAVGDTISQTSFIDTANNANASVSPTATAPVASYSSSSNSPQAYAQTTSNPSTLLSGPYSLADVVALSIANTSVINANADTQTAASVPEPTSLVLLACGGLFLHRRRKAAK